DKEQPLPNADNPQNHIKFTGLECHESENLYLTDEALQLQGTDWTTAQAAIFAVSQCNEHKAWSVLLVDGTGI
ncbi:hypothetical protein ACQR14_35585, partial [Bradyrhizobium oligotrophicum]